MQDTSEFLRKINEVDTIPDNSYQYSQAENLFTSIPNSERINAAKTSLEVITKFVSLILMLNNFVFNGKNYSQIKIRAMGTNSVPAYDNIFMGVFEKLYISYF